MPQMDREYLARGRNQDPVFIANEEVYTYLITDGPSRRPPEDALRMLRLMDRYDIQLPSEELVRVARKAEQATLSERATRLVAAAYAHGGNPRKAAALRNTLNPRQPKRPFSEELGDFD